MSFRHVVMFQWADGVGDDTINLVANRLGSLRSTIPEIRGYQLGSDLGISDGNFDFAIVADFDSEADWAVYRDHPDHVAIVTELIKPNITARTAVQYETTN